jgi:hypothetical protein
MMKVIQKNLLNVQNVIKNIKYFKMIVKKYAAGDYKCNSFNLLVNERKLLIMALLKSDWDIKKAFKLNFPVSTISLNAYNKMLLRHHISVLEKSYLKVSEIK